MSNVHERYKKWTHKFIQELSKDVIEAGGTQEEFCVLLETITTAVMMILVKHYKMQPTDAATYVEEILDGALVRFTKEINKRPK